MNREEILEIVTPAKRAAQEYYTHAALFKVEEYIIKQEPFKQSAIFQYIRAQKTTNPEKHSNGYWINKEMDNLLLKLEQ